MADPNKPNPTQSHSNIYGGAFDLSRGLRRSFPVWYAYNEKNRINRWDFIAWAVIGPTLFYVAGIL